MGCQIGAGKRWRKHICRSWRHSTSLYMRGAAMAGHGIRGGVAHGLAFASQNNPMLGWKARLYCPCHLPPQLLMLQGPITIHLLLPTSIQGSFLLLDSSVHVDSFLLLLLLLLPFLPTACFRCHYCQLFCRCHCTFCRCLWHSPSPCCRYCSP